MSRQQSPTDVLFTRTADPRASRASGDRLADRPTDVGTGIGRGATRSRADLLVCEDVANVRALYRHVDRCRVAESFANNRLSRLEPEGRFWGRFMSWRADDRTARQEINIAFGLFPPPVGPDFEPVWAAKRPQDRLKERKNEVGSTSFARGYRLVPLADDDTPMRARWPDDTLLAANPWPALVRLGSVTSAHVADCHTHLTRSSPMRRLFWGLGLAAPAAVAAYLAIRTPESIARPAAPNPEAAASKLPVKQVVLFSSGVGYFQREGEVEGDARVDLTFPVGDINDLIKSLTLQDFGGGLVTAVTYDSHDPVERTLKSFAVDLTSNPSQAQLLDQARGEKVEVLLQQSAAQQSGTLAGTVVGVEQHKQAGKEGPEQVAVLNLWCADGLRSVKLGDVQRVRFLNPVLESEYRRALDTLALSHDAQKKAVSLAFSGQGKRKVRVGYVTESPVWKTSYRLVLGDKEHKPYLQGWAVVENPTDEDWGGIRMALVSGRPISFKMDLYQPLYAPRPTVEPELFASLRPQTYEADMDRPARPALAGVPPANQPMRRSGRGGGGFGGQGGPGGPDGATRGEALQALGRSTDGRFIAGATLADKLEDEMEKLMELHRGVASAATADKLGTSFRYMIEQPVNLPRQKSALLPIVQKDVEGTRVSVYNPAVHAKFPLHGLRLKNTTGVSLMQGPVTVFDGSVYAGDARISDLQPAEDRLLTYAIDLGTEVEAKSKVPPSRITAVKVKKGVLTSTTKQREERTYHAVNRSDTDRTLLIEHPYRPEFHLVGDVKPAERTRSLYRFEVKVPAGKDATQEVVEERDLQQSVNITNTDEQQIRLFLQQPVLSDPVRKALEQAVSLRGKLAGVQRDLQNVGQTLKQIEQDQGRLRANLKEMPPTAAAYKRYLEKFDQQETQIEQLQAKRDQLQQEEHRQKTAYDGYLMALDVQ